MNTAEDDVTTEGLYRACLAHLRAISGQANQLYLALTDYDARVRAARDDPARMPRWDHAWTLASTLDHDARDLAVRLAQYLRAQSPHWPHDDRRTIDPRD